MSENLLEIKNLKKYFAIREGLFSSGQLKAVDDVSFEIKRGETLGLVGESGCGKTTCARTILNLYTPTGGEIIFDGKKIEKGKDLTDFRKRTSMVFQDPFSSLDPRMTVSDIIGEPLDVMGLCKDRKERSDRIRRIMSMVGLNSEHAARYAHEFSGGQRQRVGIARALVTEPDLVICDEPVSALDVSIQAQILNMFEDLREKMGLTILFIAHDILVVRHICDRIAVMYLGQLVEMGDADLIYEVPLHPYTRTLMSSVPIPDPVKARNHKRIELIGEIPSPLNAPTGCRFHTRCPYARDICKKEMPPLKEGDYGRFVACHRTTD